MKVVQNMACIVKFLQECDIITQYNMLGTSMKNDVAERRNCTPDIWLGVYWATQPNLNHYAGETLKKTVHFNRVSTF